MSDFEQKSNKEKQEVERRTRESRINDLIIDTRKSFSPDAIYAPYENKELTQRYFTNEFGFHSPQSLVVRRYIWLCIKLIALYVAKSFNWLFRRR